MKLRIASNGTIRGTRVYDADSGVRVENVTHVVWCIDSEEGVAHAEIRLSDVRVDVEGETLPGEDG